MLKGSASDFCGGLVWLCNQCSIRSAALSHRGHFLEHEPWGASVPVTQGTLPLHGTPSSTDGCSAAQSWGHLKGSYLKSGKMPGRGGFVFGKELHVQGNRLQVDSKSILNAPFGREDSCANLPLSPAKMGPGAGMSLWHCSSWTEKWEGVRWVGAGRFAREREQPALLTHALPSFPSRAGGQVVLSSSQSRDCKIRCEGWRFTLERRWMREDKSANLQTMFVRNTFFVCVCAWAAFFNVHDAQIRLSQKQMA